MEQRFHFGIYAVIVQEKQIALILKGRGEYKGAWDLPGGSIEHGESAEETLQREALEETGLRLSDWQLWELWSHRGVYQPAGEAPRDLHHMGGIYFAKAHDESSLLDRPDGEDALGARWISLQEAAGMALTPFAMQAVARLASGEQENFLT